MKRIIIGEGESARATISEISLPDFDLMKESINHLKKKYYYTIGAPEEEMIKIAGLDLSVMTVDDFKSAINYDLDIIKVLEIRFMTLVLSNNNNSPFIEIAELTFDEFKVLVDAIHNYCLDITHTINLDADSLKKAAIQVIGGAKSSEEQISEALNKITSEEYREDGHKKATALNSILEIINQPHEEEGVEKIPSKIIN